MITSVQNETIKNILKLHQSKYRQEENKYLIEGYHLVEEAHKKGVIDTIIYHDTLPKAYQAYPLLEVTKQIIEKLSFTKTPQPIMAVCRKMDTTIDYQTMNKLVILDGLQDPGNVGTIIRTSLAFGYDGVILSEDCVDVYNDKCLRATQGSFFHIPCIQTDIKKVIAKLQEHKIKVYATSLNNATKLEDIQKENHVSLVFGNEGKGMKEEIIKLCDESIYIDIQGIDSLNVAVTAAILLHYFK